MGIGIPLEVATFLVYTRTALEFACMIAFLCCAVTYIKRHKKS